MSDAASNLNSANACVPCHLAITSHPVSSVVQSLGICMLWLCTILHHEYGPDAYGLGLASIAGFEMLLFENAWHHKALPPAADLLFVDSYA